MICYFKTFLLIKYCKIILKADLERLLLKFFFINLKFLFFFKLRRVSSDQNLDKSTKIKVSWNSCISDFSL